jgi:hypothetical protein
MVGTDHPMSDPERWEIWREYAEQVMGKKDYFNGSAIPLFYDLWFKSKDYRKLFIDRIKSFTGWSMKFSDEVLNDVPRIGRGSSFDGMTYDGRAQEMAVHQRWKGIKMVSIPADLLKLNEELIKGIK